jgi:membrane protease YdiL (CAAX protease family)
LFQFFYAFGLGLVLGYVYMRTSRLRYSMAMHMLVNFNGGIVAPWVMRQIDPKLLDALQAGGSSQETLDRLQGLGAASVTGLGVAAVYGLAMMSLLAAGIVLLIIRRRRVEFYVAPEELPRGMRARTALWNVGMIGYTVLCLLMIAYALVAGLL